MTLPAANAFLKILEEPGGNTVYILTTGRLASLLPTILSRCHRLPLFAAAGEQESIDAADVDALLEHPDRLRGMDLQALIEPFGGQDKREQLSRFAAYVLRRIDVRIAEHCRGETPSAGPFHDFSMDRLFELAEVILALAEDFTWNVNIDLALEDFAARARTIAARRDPPAPSGPE